MKFFIHFKGQSSTTLTWHSHTIEQLSCLVQNCKNPKWYTAWIYSLSKLKTKLLVLYHNFSQFKSNNICVCHHGHEKSGQLPNIQYISYCTFIWNDIKMIPVRFPCYRDCTDPDSGSWQGAVCMYCWEWLTGRLIGAYS